MSRRPGVRVEHPHQAASARACRRPSNPPSRRLHLVLAEPKRAGDGGGEVRMVEQEREDRLAAPAAEPAHAMREEAPLEHGSPPGSAASSPRRVERDAERQRIEGHHGHPRIGGGSAASAPTPRGATRSARRREARARSGSRPRPKRPRSDPAVGGAYEHGMRSAGYPITDPGGLSGLSHFVRALGPRLLQWRLVWLPEGFSARGSSWRVSPSLPGRRCRRRRRPTQAAARRRAGGQRAGVRRGGGAHRPRDRQGALREERRGGPGAGQPREDDDPLHRLRRAPRRKRDPERAGDDRARTRYARRASGSGS